MKTNTNKKSLKISLVAALCVTSIAISNASALVVSNTDATNNNVALLAQIVKSKNIDKMITRANNLDKYAEQYIFLTGKIPTSINDIKNQFNLSDESVANYTDGDLSLNTDVNKYQIVIGHLFNGDIDGTTLKLLENSSVLSAMATINENPKGDDKYDPSISYTMSPELVNFVTQIKTVESNPNNIISSSAPSDISKTWYQPDGNGHFNIYKYVEGKWKNIGSIKTSGMVVNSVDELKQYDNIVQPGAKAYVKSADGLDTYVFDGEKWGKVATASNGSNGSGGLFNGTATIKTLATTIFNKSGGSIAEVVAPNGEWKGSLTFTKKDDATAEGYWISKDGKYVVFHNIADIPMLDVYFKAKTIAYIVGTDGKVLKLQKRSVPGKGYEWVYLTNSLEDALNYLNEPKTSIAGNYVYITLPEKEGGIVYEQRSPDDKVLQPILGKYFISSGGRNLFNTFKKGYFYLTKINDCTDNTCYHNDENQKIDGFNVYFYTPDLTDKNLNHLTDAVVLKINQPVVNQTYNVYDEALEKYGDIFHLVYGYYNGLHDYYATDVLSTYPVTAYLYINANVIGKHYGAGDSCETWWNSNNYGSLYISTNRQTGDSAIQIGNFPGGSNINIINKATICGGGGANINGGCAIAVPYKNFLNNVKVNIENEGQINGAVLNQLLHWDFTNLYSKNPLYNGRDYCIR